MVGSASRRVPAWAVLACFVLMASTSGHELGGSEVEVLADVGEPDGPIRAPLHKQQPCCLQTPVPASCQCFVVQKSSPVSDVVVPRTRGSEAAAGNIADLRMQLAAATEDVNMPAAASKLGAEAQATAEKLAVVNQQIKAAEDQAAEGKEEVKEAKKDAQKEEKKADEAKEEEAAEKTKGKSDEKAAGEAQKEEKKEEKKVAKVKKEIEKEKKEAAKKGEEAQEKKKLAKESGGVAKEAKKKAKKEGENQADRDKKDAAETDDAKKAVELKKAEGKEKEAAEDKAANKAKAGKEKMKAKEAEKTAEKQEGVVKQVKKELVVLSKEVTVVKSIEVKAEKKKLDAEEAEKKTKAEVKERKDDLENAAKGAISSAKAANDASVTRKKEDAEVGQLTAAADALKKKSAAVTKDLGSSVKAESNDKAKAASEEERAQSLKDEEDKEKEIAQDDSNKMKDSVNVVEGEQKTNARLVKEFKAVGPSQKPKIEALEKQYHAELALEEEPRLAANKAHGIVTTTQPKCDKMEFSSKDMQVRIAGLEAEVKTDTKEFNRLKHLAEEKDPKGHIWTVRYGGCAVSDDIGEMASMAVENALNEKKEAERAREAMVKAEAEKVKAAQTAAAEAAIAVSKDKQTLVQAEVTIKSPKYYYKEASFETAANSNISPEEQDVKALETKVAHVEAKVQQMEHRKEVKADEVQKKLKEDRAKVQDSKEAVKNLKAVLEKAEANLSDQRSRTDEAPPNEAPPELQANPPVGGKGTAAAESPEAEAAEEVDNAADKQDAKEGARSGPPLSPELEEKSLANARKMDREDIQPDNAREAEAPVLGESPEVEAAEEVDRAADKLAKATTKEEKAEAEDELKMAQEKQDAKAGPDSRAPLSPAELEEKSLTNARKMDQEGTMSSPAAAATDEPADDTGMPLDKTTKRMLAAYVQQKRSLCQISFQEKSPHQPKQMEKSVKLQLNCAKEANVKGAIKRRELRVAMAKKVTALSACATTAYAKAEKRVSLLEVKLVNSNVDLAGWKAKKQEKDAELAECNNELQVAKTARAEARATLSSIHDRMQMLKAQAGSDGDKMIAGLKKARADEASKKAQIKESLAKLKSEGGSSIEAKRKAIKMMKQLAAEENKVAADMKMAAKDHAKVLKSRFVAEQLKELGDGVFANQTAATKRLETVKSDQKKIADTEKVEAEQAKKDQQKLKNEKAKLKDEEAQTKKLELEANQEKKKVQGAEKKVKDEDAKEKKAEKKVEKEEKKADKDKEKAAEAEEKVTQDRRKEASEKAKIPELKEEAKQAEKKVVAVKEEVSETKEAAKDAENTDGKAAKAERQEEEAEKANMDAKKAEFKTEAKEEKVKADEEKLKEKKKNVKQKEETASKDKTVEAKTAVKVEEAKSDVQTLKDKQAAAKASEIGAEVASKALRVDQERLQAKLSEDQQKLEAKLGVSKGKAVAAEAEAKAQEAKSEHLLNELDEELPKLEQQRANATKQVDRAKKLDTEARAAKADVTSVQEMEAEDKAETTVAQNRADALEAKEKDTKAKLDTLAKTVAPNKAVGKEAIQVKGLLKQANTKEDIARVALKAARKDLERKTADKEFSEKVADEHLTGHVRGALYEAARAAHANAEQALKAAKGHVVGAVRDRVELAAKAKTAAEKSLKMDVDMMPQIQGYFETKQKLKAENNATQAAKHFVAERRNELVKVEEHLKEAKLKAENVEDEALQANDAASEKELKEATFESKVAIEKKRLQQTVKKASIDLAISAAAKAKQASRQHAQDMITKVQAVAAKELGPQAPPTSASEVKEAQEAASAAETNAAAAKKALSDAQSGSESAEAAHISEEAEKKTDEQLKSVDKKVKDTKSTLASAEKENASAQKNADKVAKETLVKGAQLAKAKADHDEAVDEKKQLDKATKPEDAKKEKKKAPKSLLASLLSLFRL